MSNITNILRNSGYTLFTSNYGNAKYDAQRNLAGLTHYVEDSTLRYFHSKIISTKALEGGMLYYIIESVALDSANTRRGFRFVVFDLEGTVLERPDLDASFRTSEQARKAMWKWLDAFDTHAHYLEVLRKRAIALRGQAQTYDDAAELLAAQEVAQ